jgi:hypothetical protein
MDCVAVCANTGKNGLTVFVGEHLWFRNAYGSAADGLFPGEAGVIDPESYSTNGISVAVDVIGDRVTAAQRSREYETYLSLLNDIRGAISLTCFRAGVSYERHAKGGAIEVSGLTRIANIELDVVDSL